MSRQGEGHLVVAHQDVWMMLGLLGIVSHLVDELHCLAEILKRDRPLDGVTVLRPLGKGSKPFSDLLFGEFFDVLHLIGHDWVFPGMP